MSKNGKNGGLGASPDNGGNENSRRVAVERKVGKGLPPKEHRWKPGQSGNPSGKPSAAREVSAAVIKARLGQVDPKFGTSALERIVERMIRLALQGSYKDKKLLLAYGLGMPKQSMDLEVFSYTEALTRMKDARRQLDEHRAGLAAGKPTNGHTDAQTAQVAAAMPEQSLSTAREDDAEPIEQPVVERGPITRVVV